MLTFGDQDFQRAAPSKAFGMHTPRMATDIEAESRGKHRRHSSRRSARQGRSTEIVFRYT
ncbi:hypothetical protein BN2476_520044 [Paraburkholderia piptadeniae]|uniref:Uncharacterized protein n=1 Tax=Paraburkholderia piptadeniae TaxID=1701573 RepID=A0A1N7SH25_9BURK|nr:hypothetical protein BN2476_520044 [Paraburkholderia piptadeniae]